MVYFTRGYFILERPNTCIVLSIDARVYAVAKLLYDHLDDDHNLDLVYVQLTILDLN